MNLIQIFFNDSSWIFFTKGKNPPFKGLNKLEGSVVYCHDIHQ